MRALIFFVMSQQSTVTIASSLIHSKHANHYLTHLLKKHRVPEIQFEAIHTYPLDDSLFMQGLLWEHEQFTISSGLYGLSKLLRINQRGEVVQKLMLPKDIFAESITRFKGLLYQLTYKEGVVYVYDNSTFNLIKSYHIDGEGWGITAFNDLFYLSNGSDKVTIRHGTTFKKQRDFTVKVGTVPIRGINDLTHNSKFIFANVFPSSIIMMIEPKSGQVKGWLNIEQFKPACKPDYTCVANGLYFKKTSQTLLVSGKRWSRIYEIKLV